MCDVNADVDLSDFRLTYAKGGLLESEVHSDPVAQFEVWFEQAHSAGVVEPNAMALATVSADGAPNCRTVLLKSFNDSGFVFYTNMGSRKGEELQANPRSTLLFYWKELERQVRIRGPVSPLERQEVEAYFQTRPRGHQLGAWASAQSSVVPNREVLEDQLAVAEARFADRPIPLPPHWGGYRVKPHAMEFWQGRPNRLHDRLEYVLAADGIWTLRRLSP